jgi:hypothetical protein
VPWRFRLASVRGLRRPKEESCGTRTSIVHGAFVRHAQQPVRGAGFCRPLSRSRSWPFFGSRSVCRCFPNSLAPGAANGSLETSSSLRRKTVEAAERPAICSFRKPKQQRLSPTRSSPLTTMRSPTAFRPARAPPRRRLRSVRTSPFPGRRCPLRCQIRQRSRPLIRLRLQRASPRRRLRRLKTRALARARATRPAQEARATAAAGVAPEPAAPQRPRHPIPAAPATPAARTRAARTRAARTRAARTRAAPAAAAASATQAALAALGTRAMSAAPAAARRLRLLPHPRRRLLRLRLPLGLRHLRLPLRLRRLRLRLRHLRHLRPASCRHPRTSRRRAAADRTASLRRETLSSSHSQVRQIPR